MTALVTDIEVKPASLLPEKEETAGVSGLDRIGKRYAPGLSRVAARSEDLLISSFEEMGLEDTDVVADELETISFADWCERQGDDAILFHYRTPPITGGIVATIPAGLINRLVDIHFGGTGEATKASATFSPAERLFLDRFGEKFAPTLSKPWDSIIKFEPKLRAIATEMNDLAFFKPHELIVIQPFTMTLADGEKAQISILYPVSGLRNVPALTDMDGIAVTPTIDPIWYDSLNEALMQVHLPLRTILARPEISLKQLMDMKVGDVIPVFMPNRIPMSVAGRLFAHGTVGAANNRIAVKVEEIEKGRK